MTVRARVVVRALLDPQAATALSRQPAGESGEWECQDPGGRELFPQPASHSGCEGPGPHCHQQGK